MKNNNVLLVRQKEKETRIKLFVLPMFTLDQGRMSLVGNTCGRKSLISKMKELFTCFALKLTLDQLTKKLL